jgi:hypothetical protein
MNLVPVNLDMVFSADDPQHIQHGNSKGACFDPTAG